jgi:hypothetical protein
MNNGYNTYQNSVSLMTAGARAAALPLLLNSFFLIAGAMSCEFIERGSLKPKMRLELMRVTTIVKTAPTSVYLWG